MERQKRRRRGATVAELPEGQGGEPTRSIALEFPHGLGDLVQLSILIRHLWESDRRLQIDAICDTGKRLSITPWERARHGFQDTAYNPTSYTQVIRLGWPDCSADVDGLPSTKTYRTVTEVFHLDPRQEWWSYACMVGEAARFRAARYLHSIAGVQPGPDGRYPVALVHYRGYSSRMQKDIPVEILREFVPELRRLGMAVALLDVDGPPSIAVELDCHCPVRGNPVWALPGSADPETMLALIDASALMIGIDSGPLHLAGCSSTPTIGVWTHHHPIKFFDFAANVVHLVPTGHARLCNGPKSAQTFRERYRHATYANMGRAIVEQAEQLVQLTERAGECPSVVFTGLKSTSYDEAYYREHVMGGLDYLGHGDWQISYGRWLATALSWRGKSVLDVGCACGSILRGLGEAGIVTQGIDLSDYMVRLGREKWPDMAPLLHVCDAANLHLFGDASWDGLHCAQVAEHWKPELVPTIVAELARVTRDGGLWFCCLDTTELFERQKRPPDGGDPTHICVKPLSWWHETVTAGGWEIVSDVYRDRLSAGCDSFLRRYDWEWFVARRVPREET